MKKMDKKGFTIVELVIVIAVIAILAAVLIPTYSSLVKKANKSADEQAVRQMNTAMAVYLAENDAPTTAAELRKALSECGINGNTEPVTQGYAFYYAPSERKFVLVSAENYGSIKSDYIMLSSNDFGKPESVSDASDLQSKISASTDTEPVLVTLTADLTVTSAIKVENKNTVVIDLNGHTLTQSDDATDVDKGIFYATGGSLTIKGGTLKGRRVLSCTGSANASLYGVTIGGGTYSNGATTSVYAVGLTDLTMVDCTVNTDNYYAVSANSNKNESDGSRFYIEGCQLTGYYMGIYMPTYSDVTIKDSTVSGGWIGAEFLGCNATLVNSKFVTTKEHSMSLRYFENLSEAVEATDIIFACGTGTGYAATGVFRCENVTGDYTITEGTPGGVTLIGKPSGTETRYGQ